MSNESLRHRIAAERVATTQAPQIDLVPAEIGPIPFDLELFGLLRRFCWFGNDPFALGDQIIEVSLSVRLAPETDSPVAADRVVFGLHLRFVVQRADNLVRFHRDLQCVPLRVARGFNASELRSLAVDNLVDAEGIFERVVASDVVGFHILGPPDHAASLVDNPLVRFQPDAEFDIGIQDVSPQNDIEDGICILRRLGEHPIFAVLGDDPLSDCSTKAVRGLTDGLRLEVPFSLAGRLGRLSQVRGETEHQSDPKGPHTKVPSSRRA